jgi:lipid-binding SYLF domain-containing protein
MTKVRTPFVASVLLLGLAVAPLWATSREVKTVESATETVRTLSTVPLQSIPRGLLHDAAGVAVIPHVVRAGLLIDGRFGRGVVLVHQPDGSWSNPIFVTLSGSGVGGQAGIESTDLVLVFKTRASLDRALRGKLTLGADVSVAAGPLGREVEVASDRPLKADIYTYSRSRGLFAGVALEGDHLHIDAEANEAFYRIRSGHAPDVLAHRCGPIAVAEALKAQVAALSGVVVPPPVLVVPVEKIPYGPPHTPPVYGPPPYGPPHTPPVYGPPSYGPPHSPPPPAYGPPPYGPPPYAPPPYGPAPYAPPYGLRP